MIGIDYQKEIARQFGQNYATLKSALLRYLCQICIKLVQFLSVIARASKNIEDNLRDFTDFLRGY